MAKDQQDQNAIRRAAKARQKRGLGKAKKQNQEGFSIQVAKKERREAIREKAARAREWREHLEAQRRAMIISLDKGVIIDVPQMPTSESSEAESREYETIVYETLDIERFIKRNPDLGYEIFAINRRCIYGKAEFVSRFTTAKAV